MLADRVHIVRRFQRSIRIDTDVGASQGLEGFICPQSSADVLETMASHVRETGQGAYTWTGPYGSGKSSLVLALSALLVGDDESRRSAATVVGGKVATVVWEALPPRKKGWHVLPVVGRRDSPARVIGEALDASGLLPRKPRPPWTEQRVLEAVQKLAVRDRAETGGLVLFIDEMGKFLEAAAHERADIYVFQQLAELASRSHGRLIIVGILHQAFEEYAHRLSREMRSEWSKVQGRFVDLSINVRGDEQISLLGRAIESDLRPRGLRRLASGVTKLIRRKTSPQFAKMLEQCWPLHPVVACLLGPMSRHRFGQNQRSLFGFLNSAEPEGFQDFLRQASSADLYCPDRFWDYLHLNLEPSILASPDGHRWALALDALERCESTGASELHLRLLKTVAIVDMFKHRSGLVPCSDLLKLIFSEQETSIIDQAMSDLQRWSLIIYRKYTETYAVFEGSDFDMELAVTQTLDGMQDIDSSLLNSLASMQPIVAKHHYHDFGALRWFDVRVGMLSDLTELIKDYSPNKGAIGAFFLAIPSQNESEEIAIDCCKSVALQHTDFDVVAGFSKQAWNIPDLARELVALEQVRDETPQLQGDRVARAELRARLSSLQEQFDDELGRAFDSAIWHFSQCHPTSLRYAELNSIASELADARFKDAPHLHNELLCRIKLSTSAAAARNALLRRMVLNEGEERLGINGFPAEGGLFASLLEATGLYRNTPLGWRFVAPSESIDPCRLAPAWKAIQDLLEANRQRAVRVSEIYDIWSGAPFGIKEGVLPVLAVAFFLSQRDSLAWYRQGLFQVRVADLDVDFLTRDPTDIQFRWMDLSAASRRLLAAMAGVVRILDPDNLLKNSIPLDVAKGLVAIYDRLPSWVGRTQHLSENAKRIRQMFKKANDPNALIFDDIPNILGNGYQGDAADVLQEIEVKVREGLSELQQAYPSMLHRLREMLLAELQVANTSPSMLAELRARAANLRELSGDHRIEAFVVRLTQFQGSNDDMQSLASMAANKPAQAWVDNDIDRATVELADMARRFIRMEALAHVKGRQDKRHSMAVVVNNGGRLVPIHGEFDITDLEQKEVDVLIERVRAALPRNGKEQRHIILAALAELSGQYLDTATMDTTTLAESKQEVL